MNVVNGIFNHDTKTMFFLQSKKERLQLMQGIHVTSKSSLKLQCLMVTKGNVKEAKELYDFLSDDIPSLPDFDPQPTTWVENTKETASGLFTWLKENQDTVANLITMGRNLIGGKAVTNPVAQTPLPPIN